MNFKHVYMDRIAAAAREVSAVVGEKLYMDGSCAVVYMDGSCSGECSGGECSTWMEAVQW